MADNSLMHFWLMITPFLLMTVTLSWSMGKASGIAECNEKYGCYSVGYPLAMMYFFLGVLPSMAFASYFGVPESNPAPVIASLAGFITCLASLMLGWRYGVRQWKAEHEDAGDAEKDIGR